MTAQGSGGGVLAMTDARLDEILRLASLRAGTGDFAEDVACCVSFRRSGTARAFGSPSDGLDIIGCGWQPGNGVALVRSSNLASEAVLWLHEYGHNVGLPHNTGGLPVCGNGIRESGEACDGAQLGTATCQTQGFDAGTLACGAGCVYDLSLCTHCPDADDDGVKSLACQPGGDCDENDASIRPGAAEICGDGIDQDCNGADMRAGCKTSVGTRENCTNGVGDDRDGLVDCADDGCKRNKACR